MGLKINLIVVYKCFLAIFAIFLFYSHLDIYLYESGSFPTPLTTLRIFFLLSAPIFVSYISHSFKYLSKPLIIWCFFYISISVIYLTHFTNWSEIAIQELDTRILSVIYLVTMHLIFSEHSMVQKVAIWAIAVIAIVTTVNNFIELTNPDFFGGVNTTGRPAGFYLNPNIAGGSLICSMIFCVSIIPRKLRLPFIFIVGIGAFMTFSRGAILSWILMVIFFSYKKIISLKKVFFGIGFIGALQIFLGSALLITTLEEMNILNDNIAGRLVWFQDPSSRDADDDTSRLDIVEVGWYRFLKSPIIGNGIGTTHSWSAGLSTHNIYLNLIIDHGFLGILIMPLLVYATIKGAYGKVKDISFIFAGFILLWGIFSHNVLDERYMLTTFSLMAAMTMQSQFDKSVFMENR
ncbi:O-Antigen ligase [Rivularia sp. PCC 7116]|uniref:O-antigen ligase family protein n=1 Tax=Rivularia sp. PCC 7116 TaxID=373994 RepID=UPI00029F3609|nr:O-antigen ligase family protein [Rivularia sp. PCC 7116]AFY52860.1 O-Antigen ligase [Rivularia sp. PCC 7116]